MFTGLPGVCTPSRQVSLGVAFYSSGGGGRCRGFLLPRVDHRLRLLRPMRTDHDREHVTIAVHRRIPDSESSRAFPLFELSLVELLPELSCTLLLSLFPVLRCPSTRILQCLDAVDESRMIVNTEKYIAVQRLLILQCLETGLVTCDLVTAVVRLHLRSESLDLVDLLLKIGIQRDHRRKNRVGRRGHVRRHTSRSCRDVVVHDRRVVRRGVRAEDHRTGDQQDHSEEDASRDPHRPVATLGNTSRLPLGSPPLALVVTDEVRLVEIGLDLLDEVILGVEQLLDLHVVLLLDLQLEVAVVGRRDALVATFFEVVDLNMELLLHLGKSFLLIRHDSSPVLFSV
jgi:hypothetical protein